MNLDQVVSPRNNWRDVAGDEYNQIISHTCEINQRFNTNII